MATIGIDLGTTFSCVSYAKKDKLDIIENKNTGKRLLPSIVSFDSEQIMVGYSNAVADCSIFEIKRIMGRKFEEIQVQEDIKKWPFTVVENEENNLCKIRIKFCNRETFILPEEFSALILMELKMSAEIFMDKKIKNAVITVPAYFTNRQRQATIDAAKIAELNVIKLINEPTAAAIAYGYHKKINQKSKILVFDLGGGTFDVSIMQIENGIFKVLGIGGDIHLGGTDFDDRLTQYFIKMLKEEDNIDILQNKNAINRLRRECIEAKIRLSQLTDTTVFVEYLQKDYNFKKKLSRATFEKLNEDLFKKIIEIVESTLNNCTLKKSDIDDIVLVGGSSRIPKIKEMLLHF